MTGWISAALGASVPLLLWLLTRRSELVDRMGEKREKLAESYIKAEQGLLDRLEQRIADLDEALRSERKDCEKRQDELEAEVDQLRDRLAVLQALLIRHGINIPAPGHQRRGDPSEGAA